MVRRQQSVSLWMKLPPKGRRSLQAMATLFFSWRSGWLEYDDRQLAQVKEIVSSEDQNRTYS